MLWTELPAPLCQLGAANLRGFAVECKRWRLAENRRCLSQGHGRRNHASNQHRSPEAGSHLTILFSENAASRDGLAQRRHDPGCPRQTTGRRPIAGRDDLFSRATQQIRQETPECLPQRVHLALPPQTSPTAALATKAGNSCTIFGRGAINKRGIIKNPHAKKPLTKMAHAINGQHSSTIACLRWDLPAENAILSGERRPAWC